jgi:hypothetical protein
MFCASARQLAEPKTLLLNMAESVPTVEDRIAVTKIPRIAMEMTTTIRQKPFCEKRQRIHYYRHFS